MILLAMVDAAALRLFFTYGSWLKIFIFVYVHHWLHRIWLELVRSFTKTTQ
jgi:hypothetical protein